MPGEVLKGESVHSDDHNSVAITAVVPNTDSTVSQISLTAPGEGRPPILTLGSELSPIASKVQVVGCLEYIQRSLIA